MWYIFYDVWPSWLIFVQIKAILVYGCSFREKSEMRALSVNLLDFGYWLKHSNLARINACTFYGGIFTGSIRITWDILVYQGDSAAVIWKFTCTGRRMLRTGNNKFLNWIAVCTFANFVLIFCPFYRSRYRETWRSGYFWDYWSGKGIVEQRVTSFSGKTKPNSETSNLPHSC